MGRNVDLAMEDRLQKCDQVIDLFFEMRKSQGLAKGTKRDGEIKEKSVELVRALDFLLNKTKAEMS